MTKIHQIQATNERRTLLPVAGLLFAFQNGLAAIGSAVKRYRTLRAVAALPPERLRDCGIDPSLSRGKSVSPDEARLSLSLMSMR